MKTLALCLGLAAFLVVPGRAQMFRPEAVRGAVLGGIVGGVIGHNDGRRGWEGAAYGAAAGALIGSRVGESRERHLPPVPRYRPGYADGFREPLWRRHQGWAHDHRRGPAGFRAPGVSPIRVYRYSGDNRYFRPIDRATRGLVIGGALGAIIGHNDGRRGWEGAAYGAGAGWLLGVLADRINERREEERCVQAEAGWVSFPGPGPADPVPAVIHHHYHGSPAGRSAGGANALFGR